MEITIAENYDELSEIASARIIKAITDKPDSLLCLSSGATPQQTYRNLHRNYELFRSIRLIKFDEWCDISLEDECTCETYLKKHILDPLNVHPQRFFTYGNQSKNSESECIKIDTYLVENGPIDLILLGLGLNGHLGLIEPNRSLKQHAHINILSETTKKHAMLETSMYKPEYGITLGIADIFSAKKVLLLVSGNQKKDIVRQVLEEKISTLVPASILWLHNNAEMIIDKDVI